MRRLAQIVMCAALAGSSISLGVFAPARGDEAEANVKGMVERIEEERFLVDSAWVLADRETRFRGSARNVSRIRAGDWAVVSGRWTGGGFLEAREVKVSHDFPGHTFQDGLVKQGFKESEKIKNSKEAYHNPEVEAYVRNIGMSVVPEWAQTQFSFQFNLIQDPSLNAFALPDGSIFIHTGLLARVEDDSQLAAILGHEVGHVTERHAAQGKKKSMTTFLPAMIGAEIVGYKAGGGSQFNQVATQLGIELALGAAVNGYGRTHEDQSDRVGLRYAVEAGYDPASAPRVWDIFNQTYGDTTKVENFFYSDHSTNEVRKGNQEQEIHRHYGDPAELKLTRPVNEEGYQRAMLPLSRDNAVLDFQAKRYPLAKLQFERVLKYRPQDPLALTYLGRIALAASDKPERLREAEPWFRKAAEADPAYPDAHRELGRLLAAQKKNPEAKAELRKYLDLAPADAKDRKAVEKELAKLS